MDRRQGPGLVHQLHELGDGVHRSPLIPILWHGVTLRSSGPRRHLPGDRIAVQVEPAGDR
jgi:hypothetical protein